jgi:hypothetical protein
MDNTDLLPEPVEVLINEIRQHTLSRQTLRQWLEKGCVIIPAQPAHTLASAPSDELYPSTTLLPKLYAIRIAGRLPIVSFFERVGKRSAIF